MLNGYSKKSQRDQVQSIEQEWASERWQDITRPYNPEDVARLRGSVQIEHTLASRGAERLRQLLESEDYIRALGAMSGNQAVQQVKAGLKAIYLSGWQVAADANTAGAMYPDQSLYPANSAPELVRKINRTLQRADQIEHSEGGGPDSPGGRDCSRRSSPTPRPGSAGH